MSFSWHDDYVGRHRVLFQVAHFHRLVVVHRDEPSELLHNLQSAFLLKTFHEHVHELSPSICLVCQELECTHQVLAHTIRWSLGSKHLRFAAVRAVLYNQDSVRVPPVVLAATRGTPPVALLLLHPAAVVVPYSYPPDVALQRVTRTVRARVRRCDSSLPFLWHDDLPEEVRALLKNLLHNVFSAPCPLAPPRCGTLAASRSSTL